MAVNTSNASKAIITLLITTLLLASTACFGEESITQNGTGTYGGFYYMFDQTQGDAELVLYDGGRYQANWSELTQEWTGGMGWQKEWPKVVTYRGHFSPDTTTNAHLALQGWTTNPNVEYLIIESYGTWNPSDGSTYYGTFTSDGAEYEVYYRALPLKGIHPVQSYRYISIRKDMKAHGAISGTITTTNHFNAWKSLGLDLGEPYSMILATWVYQGGGWSDVTVHAEPETISDDNTLPNAGSLSFWLVMYFTCLLFLLRIGYKESD